MSENNREVFDRWLSDGQTWIGVFENRAFDSGNLGHRFALSFWISSFDGAEVGQTRAPDTAAGMGWKYILICKTTDATEALEALERELEHDR